LLNFFYHDRILGQAGRKIGESVGSISRGRPLSHIAYKSVIALLGLSW
jgi:hypothetical protein